MGPILHEVKNRLGEAAVIVKVDVDKNPQASAAFQVKSVPTLVLFKNGKVLWRQAGVVPANELVLLFKQHQ